MSEIKIDNSIKNAITKGNWKDPGAKLYDDILKNTNWKDLLKEAYLVAPVNDITNDPRVRTRLNSSGCKYPHHHIKDGKLVVSISGLRSAYICARNQGYFNNDSNNRPEYSRSVVTHLNRHCKELGIEPIWHHGELYFQDIKSKKFVEYTDINEFNEDSDEKLYRVTFNDIGIYEAMRQHMSLDKWRDFLKSDNATWLPKPDKYPDGYTSYFTKEGIDKFNELVYPISCGILGDNIKYEEFDQDDIGDIVYKDNYQIIAEYKEFNEASHGKLKYDFRKGYDWNSGHGIKIIYSLDNIEITNIGKGFSTDADKDKNIKDIEKNIKNKGNMDHVSKGQKVLAIIDRVTGERLNECDYIGPFAPAISNRNLDLSDDIDDLHDYYNSKGPDFVKRYINHIKVGENDNTSVYKSTHWFKNDMKEVKDRYGYMDKVDNTIVRGTKAEALKYGRGAKMNDIDNNDALGMVGSFPKYNHPSKKDKKRNPEYYENAKMNNMIAMLNGITTSDFNLNDFYESFRESLNDIYEHADMIVISDNINKITESVDPESNPDYKKEYNTDMTEKQAKATLRTLSQDIINKTSTKDNKYKMSQYTANIYANIITKNLLPKWANGFKKFTITLNSYQSYNTLEFKIPTMSQDFIARFVDGREPINAFLHRIPEIKIKMSPRIFHTMKNPDDAFNFFKAAIQYYDSKIEKYAKHLTSEIMKMNHNLKHLVSTTKLSGLVIYPMKLLFVFDDVKMDNKDTFKISQEDINTINRFIRGIYSKYASPENEKKKIVDDVKEMVKALREACDDSDNMRELSYLSEAIDDYYHNKFNDKIKDSESKFISENIDHEGMMNADKETKAMYEKFFVKKLKKIPSDLVAYISIETEAIKDANDKMMIASYCLGKLEIVEWYIELLEVGSNKYVVPHTKPQLEAIRTQLLACYKKRMATPIPKAERPIIDIKYPAGYEG